MVLFDGFGGFIVVLALIGFLVKDAFNFPRRLLLLEPYLFKKNTDQILSNVAVAVALVCGIWYIIVTNSSANPEPLNNFFISLSELLEKISNANLLTQSEVESISKSIARGVLILTVSSLIYVISFGILFVLGFLDEILNEKAVKVSLKESGNEKIYRRILFESSDLIYLQNVDNPRVWVALKKENISQIESAVANSFLQAFGRTVYSKLTKKYKTDLKGLPPSSKGN